MKLKYLSLMGICAVLLLAGATLTAQAQETPTSDLDLPLADYLSQGGDDVKLIKPGKLKIDKHRMVCGRRPTVIDPKFDSWGGAYPGYLILNPDRLKGLPTPVKLFVFAHECGHQFVGRNEDAADCFGIKRGRRYGWLKPEGLEQVCEFISKLKGTADHAAGPKRCENMRRCYREAAPRAASN